MTTSKTFLRNMQSNEICVINFVIVQLVFLVDSMSPNGTLTGSGDILVCVAGGCPLFGCGVDIHLINLERHAIVLCNIPKDERLDVSMRC